MAFLRNTTMFVGKHAYLVLKESGRTGSLTVEIEAAVTRGGWLEGL